MIWFTADWHLAHENIIEYCDRPFKNTGEMEQTILGRYKSRVKPRDLVYFLGDLSLRSADSLVWYTKLLHGLPGRKIMIMGNHDKMTPFQYVDAGFLSVHTTLTVYTSRTRRVQLVHDPMFLHFDRFADACCGHVHNTLPKVIGPKNNIINVGVDVWDFFPVSEDEVEEIFGARYEESEAQTEFD